VKGKEEEEDISLFNECVPPEKHNKKVSIVSISKAMIIIVVKDENVLFNKMKN